MLFLSLLLRQLRMQVRRCWKEWRVSRLGGIWPLHCWQWAGVAVT